LVLVLNAGSSTLKWSALAAAGDPRPLAGGTIEWESDQAARQTDQVRQVFRQAVAALPAAPIAVGHRLVHGGARFRAAVTVTAQVRQALDQLIEIDPLHTPAALAGIDAVSAEAPDLPQVACFDTAFHVTLPEAAALYPLPWEWSERFQLRRYGFHGLSVAYSVRQVSERMGATPGRLVVCHLGSGCSLTAVSDGRSVDTTMGYTPLDGMMMATRPGALDPGLLLHLQRRCGIGLDDLEAGLQHGSGLAGVAGVGGDLRKVLAAAAGGSRRAALAYDTFLHSLVRMAGAMIAVLGGLDALVLTGGIGEHSERLQGDLVQRLAYAGVPGIAPADGGGGGGATPADDREISPPGSAVRVFVIAAREDLTVLRDVLAVLAAPSGSA
jgi:acetate kinase